MQYHLLVSTSYNQGLYDIKQLTNDSNEANQWCTIAMITIYYFTINAKEASQWSMAIYHQCNNTRSNALANHSIALKINKCCIEMFIAWIDDNNNRVSKY